MGRLSRPCCRLYDLHQLHTPLYHRLPGDMSAPVAAGRDAEPTVRLDSLPPLPELPEHLRDIPFLHKSYVFEQCGLPHVQAEQHSELNSHKRWEWIGDCYLHYVVGRWIMRDRGVNCSEAQRIASLLLCNSLFLKLATAYGGSDRLRIGAFAISTASTDKILADCFEAYFGCLSEAIDEGSMLHTTVYEYIDKLFAPDVFPDLAQHVELFKQARVNRRKRHTKNFEEKQEAKKAYVEPTST